MAQQALDYEVVGDVGQPDYEIVDQEKDYDVVDQNYLSQIKRDYVAQGGDPSDVYSPERATQFSTEVQKGLGRGKDIQNAITDATKTLEATEPVTRKDGSISAGYAPTDEALAKGMIEPSAIPAVKKAQSQGVLTVSSGFDKAKGVGFAVGKDASGKVVRVEEPPNPSLLGASLRSVGEQVIPTASAVAGTLLGAAAGAPAGPPGIVAGAIAGGAAGYKVGEIGQRGIGRMVMGDDGYADFQRLREADRSRFPVATTSLEIAAPIVMGAGAAKATQKIDRLQQLIPERLPALAKQEEPQAAALAPKGEPIRPGAFTEEGFAPGTTRPEFKMPQPPEGSKITQMAKRELSSPKVSNEAKAEIAAQPNTVREIYGVKAKKLELEEMSDEQLQNVIATSADPQEAAGARLLYKARIVDKNPADAAALFDDVNKPASDAGLFLRNLQEYINTPAGYVETVRQAAKTVNRNIPPEVSAKLGRLFEQAKIAKDAFKKAGSAYRNTLTDEAAEAAERARRVAYATSIELEKYSRGIIPKRFLTETAPEAIQLTLLSPLSLVKNYVFNVARAGTQSVIRTGANVADAVLAMAQRKPDARVFRQGATTTRAAFERSFQRSKEGIKAALTSGIPPESAIAGEGVRGVNPFKSLVQALTGRDMVVGAKGKVELADRIRKTAEGLIGLYAEPMGRGLAIGDAPFRGAAEGRLLAERALLAGKSSKQALAIARYPTKAELKDISQEAARATFQQDTKLTQAAQAVAKAINSVPFFGPLILKTNAPYIKTPVNVVTDVVDVAVPALSITKAIYHAGKGNRREALEKLSSAAVGFTIGGAAATLYNAGLITGSASKSPKERQIQYEAQPPNTINMSGLSRLLNGEDPSLQAGDDIRTFENLGYLGTIFNVYANVLFKEGSDGLLEDMANVAIYGLPNIASYTLNQTFLKSTNTLLNAIQKEEYDGYLQSLYGTVASLPFPGTLQALNRAEREYIVDQKTDDGQLKAFQNVLKARAPEWANRMADAEALPLLRNMWGQPVKQTPQGANPFLYNFLDFTRGRTVPSDETNLFLYKLWRETKLPEVLPSVPGRELVVKGKTYKLNENQYVAYQEEIGVRRKAIVDRMVSSPTFVGADPEFQIERLKQAYDDGAEAGRRVFLKQNQGELEEKKRE